MIIRETSAKYIYQEDRVIKEKQVRVLYRSRSVKKIKEQRQLIKEKGDDAFISDTLFLMLEALPDLVDQLTLEYLEEMDLENLKALEAAVDEALNPKSTPVSSPAG